MSLERPHFAQPFTRPTGRGVNVVEQDTAEHILSCQYTIASCPVGFRSERPEFGWPFPTFQSMPVDYTGLVAAFKQFEPRAPDVTVSDAQDVADAIELLTVTTRVRTDDGG